jgi:thioredoxin reductase (NADPH)
MAGPAPNSVFDTRRAQAFPTLEAEDLARVERFGERRVYRDGERLFEAGVEGPGLFLVLSGEVAVTRRDGFGHDLPVVEQGPGQFLAEVGQLSGRPSLVDGWARGPVEVVLVPPERLRALLVAEADLGERIMRALILRRVNLIETGGGGPVLIGDADAADVIRLTGFLTRNGQPHRLLDDSDDDAAILLARYAPTAADLPLVVLQDGTVLRNPSEAELAVRIGMLPSFDAERLYDIAVVGGGPAGLATAVYAASEGLSVLVLDARAFGGQAGASARIENYLGFPTGISGQALAGRAFTQAQKFGAEMAIPACVTHVAQAVPGAREGFRVRLRDGQEACARTVVIASGAKYRRPNVPDLDRHEGGGVHYWASPVETRLCAGQEVVLVGGGNSAGQAAVFLASQAARVHMLVRAPGLEASMSRYLIDRIAAQPNVDLHTRSEIVGLHADPQGRLERVRWRNRDTGAETERPVRHVFLFIGADPNTDWLAGCEVAIDQAGFVLTGGDAGANSQHGTSLPGLFAIGDVRSGSVKRVAAAVGEGAAVVAQIHAHLAAKA